LSDEKDKLEIALGRFPQVGEGVGRHLSLEEVTGLAQRRGAGEEVDLPAHVTVCPVCLEMYEVVLAGVMAPDEKALGRFTALYDKPKARIGGRFGVWKWASVAAVLVVGLGLAGVYVPMGRSTSVAAGGGLEVVGGAKVADGAKVPAGAQLVAQSEAKAMFADGSGVTIEQGARLAIQESNLGSKTVVLTHGRLEASVAKQTWGRTFEVSTPLGPVTVVGTKFSVDCGKEKVEVYEGQGKEKHEGEITVVRVWVSEGVVRVSNRSEEVHVHAGQVAVMREKQPRIDLGDGTK
jgi:hypothetical protein